tara:strand:- start:66 stop:422 length:357 start_codon:yes stop_codon:yes gene_type:complete
LIKKQQILKKKLQKKSEELWKDNQYLNNEEDRVVLYVKLSAKQNNICVFEESYFLDEKGFGENTAMGKLVSLTLSASIDLMLQNKLDKGVITAPNKPELIDYYFSILHQNNIQITKNI